ncbi:MAG: hypothetical protein LBF04_01570 [Prevotellaceae bacterium]|jgi:uncharacterized membrane protein|nr:hypothetical protein [Prevotellaceae bacterium]
MNTNEKIQEEKRKKREETRIAICNALALLAGVIFIIGVIIHMLFGYTIFAYCFPISITLAVVDALFFTSKPSGSIGGCMGPGYPM